MINKLLNNTDLPEIELLRIGTEKTGLYINCELIKEYDFKIDIGTVYEKLILDIILLDAFRAGQANRSEQILNLLKD